MAWNTEQTRRRLLDAGAVLFARHGFAGTSMDAIGRESGVNKERVYSYFGSKAGFFTAVLEDRLAGLLDGIPVAGDGPRSVGDYAVRLFDRFDANPELARLLAWESLELPEAASAGRRAETCATQAAGLRAALPGADRASAEQLLLSIVTLTAGWWTLRRVAETIHTAPGDAAARRASLRAEAEALAGALATGPQSGSTAHEG